jgi:hypothetical protein
VRPSRRSQDRCCRGRRLRPQINRLCDLSLLNGFAEERHTIDADQLEAVCQELVAVAPE